MIEKIIFKKNIFFTLFLFFFSIIINQHYGNLGVFPIDSFLHFDNGYRILNGENPFVDFWTVSGPTVDYIQAIFFYFFGVNWDSYILHASLMNASATLFTFFVLKNFKLKINYCFLYSLLFSILAYTSSGTPFVDHHSTFFSLFGVYSFLLALNSNKKFYWLMTPIFFGLAFFSKQVPAAYLILSIGFFLILYSYKKKTFQYINYSLISSITFIFLVLIFGKFQGIKLSSFFDQYIFYPQTIGSDRLSKFDFTFRGVIDHFKFIYLAFAPLFYVHLKKMSNPKKYFKSNEPFILLILLFLTFSLIWHQLLTNNQTFIFFLVPLLTAFSHIALDSIKLKFKDLIYIIMIFICLFAVTKYHLRFNENRKFHELVDVNFNLSVSAKSIHKKLERLNWITSAYGEKPEKEINIINKIKFYLKNDDRKKMLITNYTFFSSILDEKLFSPSWAFTSNGTTHPMTGNKYIKNYRKLMIDIIKKNKIVVIYIAGSLEDKHIYNYISSDCFNRTLVADHLKSYEIKDCTDISG